MSVSESELPELDERQYRICFDESDYQLPHDRFLQVGKGWRSHRFWIEMALDLHIWWGTGSTYQMR